MSFYIYSPNWFSGIDSIIEIISIIISFLIAYYSYKIYKYFDLKRYKYFAITFILIGISFIFKIISNLIFIVPKKREITFSLYQIIYTTYSQLDYIEDVSFFIHKFSLLISLLILYLIIINEKKIENILMFILYTLIISFLITSYLLFNFTIVIITMFLFFINHLKDKKKKKNSSLSLFFLGFSISYFFIFLALQNTIFYFIGEIILVFTFINLLFNLIKTFRK